MTTEPLVYQGKEMAVEPINTTMERLASNLQHGVPQVAELEPGDATYYSLLLVPADLPMIRNHFGRWGVPAESAGNYLIAVKLDDIHMHGCWIPRFEATQPHHVAGLTPNEWSRQFFAWWFAQLLDRMGWVE